MMQGDDIQKQRQEAEKNTAAFAHSNLALWVIAEQLFELRALLNIAIDRKGGQ